jgi:hypothetical protein
MLHLLLKILNLTHILLELQYLLIVVVNLLIKHPNQLVLLNKFLLQLFHYLVLQIFFFLVIVVLLRYRQVMHLSPHLL